MNVLILGSTGYTGMMLLRILVEHPHVTSIIPVSRSAAGTSIAQVDPGLGELHAARFDACGGRFVEPGAAAPSEADVVFSALPHRAAADIIGPMAGRAPIIDLSADFRFRSAEAYQAAYGTHPYPDLLPGAVYGLTEWHREEIRGAGIIACPGCYPTCVLLPLLPFAGRLRGTIVTTALSGVSGAGRKETRNLLFNERSENFAAYNPGRRHRHVPEMDQALADAGSTASLFFTPHLVPVKQGMLATTLVTPEPAVTQDEAEELVRAAYADSPFVGLSARALSGQGDLPETRDVRNTNRCDIAVRVEEGRLYLFSVIDNLYKGAAGQAVQNMNVRLGLPETAGLRSVGEF